MQYVIYTRVSTDEQAKTDISLSVQEREMRSILEQEGGQLYKLISDPAWSGGDEKRPGLLEMLDLMRRRKIDGVMFYDLNRLSRNMDITSNFMQTAGKNKIRVYSKCEGEIDVSTTEGWMRLVMNAFFSEYELRKISDRNKMVKDKLYADGRTRGRAPIGQSVGAGNLLIDNPYELKVLDLIEKYKNQGLSYTIISHLLAGQGYVGRSGISFKPSFVGYLYRKYIKDKEK